MTDARLESFLTRLRREFPEFVVVVLPFRNPDEDGIEHFIHLLNVPEDELSSATWRSLEIAFDLYGEASLPFHLTTIDPATSIAHFAREIYESRWLHTPSLIRRRGNSCVGELAPTGEWPGPGVHAPQRISPWVDDASTRSEPSYRLPASRGLRSASASSSTAYPFPDHYSLAS